MKKEHPIPQAERPSFRRVLQSLGHLEEFAAMASAGKPTAELRAWSLAKVGPGVYVPENFKTVYQQLGITRAKGGKRKNRGKTSYSVRGLRA
jgi:hypothetical protein